MSMLSQLPFPDKINAIAVAIQKTPTKPIGRNCRTHEMAEMLKQSALESLRVAASACNSVGGLKAEYLPSMSVKSQKILTEMNELAPNIPIRVHYL